MKEQAKDNRYQGATIEMLLRTMAIKINAIRYGFRQEYKSCLVSQRNKNFTIKIKNQNKI